MGRIIFGILIQIGLGLAAHYVRKADLIQVRNVGERWAAVLTAVEDSLENGYIDLGEDAEVEAAVVEAIRSIKELL